MTAGIPDAKGTSMLEDYTYNLVPGKKGILQAHMLEVCPSMAEGRMAIRCLPLSMGNREDPARLVFTCKTGRGIATSLIDLGTRFPPHHQRCGVHQKRKAHAQTARGHQLLAAPAGL